MRSLILIAVCSWLACLTPVQAREEIRSFDSKVQILSDGTLDVVETIAVRSEGAAIRHGIYRDLPRDLIQPDGTRGKVGFDVLSLERDGVAEQWSVEATGRVTRIRIGNDDVLLPVGDYVYRIHYRTDRPLRFGEAGNQILWNVTGNGWAFPILEATATVALPAGYIPVQAVVTAGSARADISDNKAIFKATQTLEPFKGLVAEVYLPQGVVNASSDASYWWRENLASVTGFAGIAIIFLYFLAVWHHIGRDPKAGPVVPRWDLPVGVSPALVDYICESGLSRSGRVALSATVIDLAVHGLVILTDLDRTIILRRTDKPRPVLMSVEQSVLLDMVDAHGGSLTFDATNGDALETLLTNFKIAVETENSDRFFLPNRLPFFIGLLGSLVVFAVWYFSSGFSGDLLASLGFSCFIPLLLNIAGWNLIKARRRTLSVAKRFFYALGIGFIVLAGLAALLVFWVSSEEQMAASAILAMLVVSWGLVAINQIFFVLNSAVTPYGAQIKDHIAGLRLYLDTAEQDRMNRKGAPQMSPAHFETLLPYAVVLGVERPWREKFEFWLNDSLSHAMSSYAPSWYDSDVDHATDGLAMAIETSFASALDDDGDASGSGGGGGW